MTQVTLREIPKDGGGSRSRFGFQLIPVINVQFGHLDSFLFLDGGPKEWPPKGLVEQSLNRRWHGFQKELSRRSKRVSGRQMKG